MNSTPTQDAPLPSPLARLSSLWARVGDFRGVVALVIMFVVGCVFSPRVAGSNMPIFLSWQTQMGILYEYCEYGLLAVGMTLVILTGGIDLSVGSVLGVSATLFALLTVGYGWGVPVAILAVIAAGMVAGTVNGFLIAQFRLQPFVVTLATMTGARGLAKLISGGIKVQPAAQHWYRFQEDTPPFFAG